MNAKHLAKLVESVQSHLTDDLRKPQYRGMTNCLAGHCYVASEALHHMLGGKESGWTPQCIQHEGGSHWYLRHRHSGAILDPTASQFNTPVPYEKGVGKGFLTKDPSKRAANVIERVRTGGFISMKKAEGPPAVSSIAVFNSEGFLLMGCRRDSARWTLPGGKSEAGETPETTARRELLEEAGLEAKTLKYLGSGSGGRDGSWKISCYRTESDEKPSAENDPDKEVDEWEWIDVRAGLPEDIAERLHNHDNDITLQLLGLQEGSANREPEELSKGLKHALIGAVAAAGMATGTPAHAEDNTPKWTPAGLHEELKPIAHLESNDGQRMNHKPNSKGEFHTAVGAVGLKPVTAHEEYSRSKWLQQIHPNLHDQNAFLHALKTNPTFYNHVATAHWQRLKKLMGGDPVKTAYAWRWGQGAAVRDSPQVYQNDPYARAYQKLSAKTAHDKWAGQLENPLGKSEEWLMKATSRKTWRSKDGLSVPHSTNPARAEYDQRFLQSLDTHFGGGVGKTLKPVKVPLSSVSTSAGNMPVVKDRLSFYTRMAREGERLPPVVVRRSGTKFDMVDGNHRTAAAQAAGLRHIDGFEIVDEKPKAGTGLPKHLNLYNLNDDPDEMMAPSFRKTKFGQFFEAPDFNQVKKKLQAKGYHGYHGHDSDPNKFIAFPKYAKLASLPSVEAHAKGQS